MRSDADHLQIIYDKLVQTHGEKEHSEHMIRLASIIRDMRELESQFPVLQEVFTRMKNRKGG